MFLKAYLASTSELVRNVAGHWRLLVALAKRDLSNEYVAHTFSVGWTIIHPLFLILVYLFVFTEVFPSRVEAPPGQSTDAIVYLLAGIIPWITLTQVMGKSLMSVMDNQSIVKQMAFPLELLPLKSIAGPLVFGGTLLVLLIGYGLWVTGGTILPAYLIGIPALILLTLVLMAGLALMLACLQVFMRDLKEFVTLFATIGLFIHPILYFPQAVPAAVRPLIYASPFSYFLFCWQDIMFFGGIERPWAWCVSIVFAFLLFVIGVRLFEVSKHHFGDFL